MAATDTELRAIYEKYLREWHKENDKRSLLLNMIQGSEAEALLPISFEEYVRKWRKLEEDY